ncbi:glycosyltransferase [Massilia forsythiae]|uniref:Glycosyltransferase n=1 Tax=Massilia forsythiae TaxID=2728020 RepID=A0A7Z2W039_9BURK|nr:glycosyltransferase family 4 protein [Massilia forsythiae]QJE02295.1 glycosyltransferase [Massilia forsythiae]
MRVLHLLDAAVLRPTDYRSRTLALIEQLRAQGVQTVHLAAPCLAVPSLSALPGLSAVCADATPHGAAPAPHPGRCDANLPDPGWHIYRTAAPAWLPAAVLQRLPARHAPALSRAAAMAAFALRVRRVARLTRPDLIHVHAGHGTAMAAFPALCGARLPAVAEAGRRAADRTLPSWERWALERAGALAASSAELRAALRGAGLGGRRIRVIPPAAEFAGTPRRDPAPPGLADAPLLAHAGGLEREAGIDLLLAVLPALRRRHPALRVVVAGGGAREDELARRIGASAMRGRVAVTGAMPSRRVADLLPRADIAVFPALCSASTPVASRHLLNAMAQGCAIVASDIACHRELLVHGHSAMLFRAGSRHALAETLARLLARPALLPALGQAAAAQAAAQHSWPATAARYRRLYQDVLAQARRG